MPDFYFVKVVLDALKQKIFSADASKNKKC
jgi:hypothetical protein